MSESFADAPVSLAEVRSDRSQKCSDWTPRDCLIDLLRQIDKGTVRPDVLVISWAQTVGPDAVNSHYSVAAPNVLAALGVVARSAYRMNAVADQ